MLSPQEGLAAQALSIAPHYTCYFYLLYTMKPKGVLKIIFVTKFLRGSIAVKAFGRHEPRWAWQRAAKAAAGPSAAPRRTEVAQAYL